MRISDWSSDVCSSDLHTRGVVVRLTAVQVDKAVSSTRASRSESASNGLCASRYSAMRSAGAGWEERGQKPLPTRFHASYETSRCARVTPNKLQHPGPPLCPHLPAALCPHASPTSPKTP